MITVKTNEKCGHIPIENNPHISNSIYRILISQVLVLISNQTENEIRLSDRDINYKCITSLPEHVVRINYVTEDEFHSRLKFLQENVRL